MKRRKREMISLVLNNYLSEFHGSVTERIDKAYFLDAKPKFRIPYEKACLSRMRFRLICETTSEEITTQTPFFSALREKWCKEGAPAGIEQFAPDDGVFPPV